MLLRTKAIVAALAAVAGSFVIGAGAASAAPVCNTGVEAADVYSSADAHSNLRSWPSLKSTVMCTTDRQLGMSIFCYQRGDFVNDGHTATDVWYYGYIGWENPYGYIWGGNVNTAQDPPPGLRAC